MEFGHSAKATFDILAAGGSPLRALQLEGARLVQALATLAALGIGAVLWLTYEQSATVDATAALEAHKFLDQILTGYGDAKKAADDYLAAADKLPEAAAAKATISE